MKAPSALARFRGRLVLTQAELAKRSGVSHRAISDIENGHMPNLLTIGKLARALGVEFDELYTALSDGQAAS
jgi:transcriptional regulator with XRE-family HTH domain